MMIEIYGIIVNSTFEESPTEQTHRLIFSDRSVMIMQQETGAVYEQAIDTIGSNYSYVETDMQIHVAAAANDEMG